MHKSGHLALIKSMLTAVPVHTAIGLGLSAWVRKAMVKIMRSFLWTGTDPVQRGRCAVAWNSIQRPLYLRGLCIPDLRVMGLVLRLRWL
jgi:hypothetical protein